MSIGVKSWTEITAGRGIKKGIGGFDAILDTLF
jgi:hypothetical protein